MLKLRTRPQQKINTQKRFSHRGTVFTRCQPRPNSPPPRSCLIKRRTSFYWSRQPISWNGCWFGSGVQASQGHLSPMWRGHQNQSLQINVQRHTSTFNFFLRIALTWSPQLDLRMTEVAQPAIVAHQMAILETLKVRYFVDVLFCLIRSRYLQDQMDFDVARAANCVLGHSVGEISAVASARAISVEEAVRFAVLPSVTSQLSPFDSPIGPRNIEGPQCNSASTPRLRWSPYFQPTLKRSKKSLKKQRNSQIK